MNPYTHQEISADSIIERVMTFAPLYETIVSEYRANLYIKGKMDIQKKNFILRYVPSMFRLQKGVREYLLETYSDLHYTAPNIYDQKVKASQGTVRGNRGLPGLLEYFNVNIYSSSLLNDERLLSPLAKNGQKYYKYQIDSVMGDPNNLDYRVRFIPRTKSDQLVGGYMVVSSNVWSVREIRFSGRSELITFTCWIKMGDVGKKNEFLPVRYDVEALFKFLGNKVDGNYTASLDYKSIELKEKKVRKKEKRKYNLSESFSLQCDTNAYKTDASTFAIMRPIPLNESEKKLYFDNALRRDTATIQKPSKSQAFWGTMGDLMVEDYKFNLSNIGSVRFSPFINPLLFSYSGSNGLSYRQDFRYNRLFRGDKLLRIVPKLGYNFTRKEFYWSLNADFEYWPQKRGFFRLNVGNGNRIYSSKVLDELKAMPDSIFNFSGNMLDMEIGFSMVQEMDPTTNVNSTITSNFYMYIFMLLFLVSDMHYFIIDAMMDSYQLVPIGGAKFSVDLYHIMVTFITNYFVIGFRIVLPIFCCMLVINIVLGILAKIAPQMNMFVVGMQLKVFVGLVLLFLTMQLFAGAADFLFDEMHTFTKYFVQAMAA